MSELALPLHAVDHERSRMSFRELCRLMRQDIRNNWGWTRPGSRALVVYRFGAWLEDQRPSLLRSVVLRLQTSMQRYVRNAYGIELSRTARIGPGVIIGHQSGIVVHEYAVIGADCVIRQGVTMGVARLTGEALSSFNAPVLGNRVDVGAGAVIMGAVKIGDDVRIFPNSVVMTDVPSNTTVMAPTSRLITMRPTAQAEETTANKGQSE